MTHPTELIIMISVDGASRANTIAKEQIEANEKRQTDSAALFFCRIDYYFDCQNFPKHTDCFCFSLKMQLNFKIYFQMITLCKKKNI